VADHIVVACDGKAAAHGIRPGLAATAATALAPRLVVHARDPATESDALIGLAGWAARYTPSLALDYPDTLLLEVKASIRLFNGLKRIVNALREGCARMGFSALIASAPTARAATWLARSGREALIEDPAQIENALAELPVCSMSGDAETLAALRSIGATSVGDVRALPRAGVARRFGQRLLDDLDRALGRLADPRRFFTPPAIFRARLELPAETAQAETLIFAARRLFVQLEGFLIARAAGVQRIELKLAHRAGSMTVQAPSPRLSFISEKKEARLTSVTTLSIGLVAPSREAEHFTLLARERLGTCVLPAPVRALALEADDIIPFAGEPLALFPGAQVPGDWRKLVERLRARLGAGAVQGIAVTEDYRPEYASSPGGEPNSLLAARHSSLGQRPFWLLPSPQPLEEIDAVPHHRGPLRLLSGPERIESGWWDGADVARDYFIAEDSNGSLLWIYRERRTPAGWFLHGVFA
jgi:protein ImuB